MAQKYHEILMLVRLQKDAKTMLNCIHCADQRPAHGVQLSFWCLSDDSRQISQDLSSL